MRRTKPGIAQLKTIALFSACTDKELEMIAATTNRLPFGAGAVMAQEGREGHEFMALVDGRARVEVRGETIAVLEAGDFFGEIALLDHGPRTATVVAETDVVVEVIGEREFTGVVQRSPHLAANLLLGLARRLRSADLLLVV
jgi:CRP-like cAMP-binding protein